MAHRQMDLQSEKASALRTITIFMWIIFMLAGGCDKDPAGTGPVPEISYMQAFDLVKQNYLDLDSTIAIYGLQTKLAANTEIPVDGYSTDTMSVNYISWYFFVNLDYPRLQFSESDYVFVHTVSGKIESIKEFNPPENFDQLQTLYPARTSTDPLNRDDALAVLMQSADHSKSAILAGRNLLDIHDTVRVSESDQFYTPSSPSWFFFIDQSYMTDDIWPQKCKFVLMDAQSGHIYTYATNYQPPVNFASMDTVYYKWQPQMYEKPVLQFTEDSEYKFAGCGFFRAHAQNDDQNAVVIIKADEDSLALTPEWKEFDLQKDIPGLSMVIDFYYYLPPDYMTSLMFHYCNDVVAYIRPPKKWYVRSGTIKISISPADRANIIIENARFTDDANKHEVQLPYLNISQLVIHWLPG